MRSIVLFVAVALALTPAVAAAGGTEDLAARLLSQDPAVRRAASREVVLLPHRIDELRNALERAAKDPDPVVAMRCRATLAVADALDPALAELVTDLGSGVREVREKAASRLGEMGPAAADAVPALITLYPITGGSYVVTQALSQIGRGVSVATPLLLAELGNPSLFVRQAVLERLRRNGPAGPEVTAVFRGLLADERSELRVAAVLGLAAVAPTEPATVPALADALDDESERVRELAARGLGELGRLAKDAVPTLALHLSDPAAVVRLKLARALSRILVRGDDPPPGLIAALHDEDDNVVAAVLESIARTGAPASIIPKLRALASSDRQRIPEAATSALWRCDPEAREDLPTLLAVIGAGGELGDEAAAALDRLARRPDAPLAEMIDLYTGEMNAGRYGKEPLRRALLVVAREAAGEGALRALVAMATDPDGWTANLALQILEHLGGAAAPAAPQLVEILEAGSHLRAPLAAAALGAIGPAGAGTSLAPLLAALDSGNPDVAPVAADALSELGVAAFDPLFTRLCRPGSSDLVVRALGGLGSAAASAVPLLVVRAREGNLAAVEAIGRIGPAAGDVAREPLAELLERRPEELPFPEGAAPYARLGFLEAVATALGEMKEYGWRGARALVTLLTSPEPRLRIAAARAIKVASGVVAGGDPILGVLLDELDDDSGEQPIDLMNDLPRRWYAVKALEAIGPGAREATPALSEMLDDERTNPIVAIAAWEALHRIWSE